MLRRVLQVATFACLWLLCSCSTPEIAQPLVHPALSKEQIHQGLLSDDMAVKLAAEQQLVNFSPEERLVILEEIRQHGDRNARLLVVEQLKTMKGDTEARNMLLDLEANDPDRMVKMKAKRVLEAFDAPSDELSDEPSDAPPPEPPSEAGEETSPAESQVGP